MKTAEIAERISGDKKYQLRARQVLPILVRQAQAGATIFYSDLAIEVGMPNPRNLNYVLGSIGTTLESLSKAWNTKVPPIQCLVVNKQTGLPGEGIGWFLVKKDDFSLLNRKQKRSIVDAELNRIFTFQRWNEVLSALSLKNLETDFKNKIIPKRIFGSGGESEEHKKLKKYVANNPNVIGLSNIKILGVEEFLLSSGDKLDVYFEHKSDWIAVEVKSAISNEADLVRGLFQCIKYKAVMEAMQVASNLPQNARALLVLEGELPKDLVPLKNILGVEVIDKIYEAKI